MPDKNIWDSIIDTAKSIIPTGASVLINAIAPPLGGPAAAIIADALGCENTPESIQAGLKTANPEQITQIIQSAHDNKVELIKLAAANDTRFKQFMLGYEGNYKELPQIMKMLRASVRPVLTYAVLSVELYLAVMGKVIPPFIGSAGVICLGFWFGPKAANQVITALQGKN